LPSIINFLEPIEFLSIYKKEIYDWDNKKLHRKIKIFVFECECEITINIKDYLRDHKSERGNLSLIFRHTLQKRRQSEE
jgi:hypothetical protein